MALRVRKGDTVAVISGNDRGKRGRVLRVIPERSRVVIEGVNLVFKHLRKSQQHPQGGRIRREAPIHMSNVMPIDPETNRPTRVGSRLEEGKRKRVGRRSGTLITGDAGKADKSTRSVPKRGKKAGAKGAAEEEKE